MSNRKEGNVQVVELNKGSQTQEQTVKDPTNVTKVEQTYMPWHNADGSVNQPMLDANNEQKASLQRAYGVDPNGNYNGPIGDILGFDPDRFKEQQEADEKLARFKKKEAGWRNAMGVITDILTAGHGGNVWERKPDNVAEKANETGLKARDNISKLGGAIAQAKAGREKAYQEAEAKRLQQFVKDYGVKVSQTQTTGGGSRKQTLTNGSYEQGYKDDGKLRVGGVHGGGGVEIKNPVEVTFPTFNTSGQPNGTQIIRVDKYQAEAYGKRLADKLEGIYNGLSKEDIAAGKVPPYIQKLIDEGVFNPNPRKNAKTGKVDSKWDYGRLIQSGLYPAKNREIYNIMNDLWKNSAEYDGNNYVFPQEYQTTTNITSPVVGASTTKSSTYQPKNTKTGAGTTTTTGPKYGM